MKNTLMAMLGACVAVALHAQPVEWPVPDWRTGAPESVGMDSRALAELVQWGQAEQMDSLLVTRRGRVVAEAYFAPYGPGRLHAVNSSTKAVLGALTGIAIARGELPATGTPVVKLLPQLPAAGKEAITLQHLLDSTSGIEWVEPLSDAVPASMLRMTGARDWARFTFEQPVVHPPGQAFNYNSGTWQVLSEVLQARTGKTAEAYAGEHLFAPLGIREWRWRQAPGGRSTGGWGLYLQPRDMARFGLLYANGGRWQDRQVVPKAWVDRAFAASVPMVPDLPPDYRYADGWWTLPGMDAYFTVGLHRQLVLVMPKTGVVAAFTGRRHYPLPELVRRVTAAVKGDGELPASADGVAALAQAVATAAVEVPGPTAPPSPLATRIDGRRWTLERNAMGVREITFQLAGQPVLEVVAQRFPGSSELVTIRYELGFAGRFAPGGTALDPVLTRARWIDEQTLHLHQRYVLDGNAADLRVRFDGDRADIDIAHTLGMRAKTSAKAAQ
jgi:CubicO group peptidase (beta-lactamase class C family)